jgi:hypothetical protein
MAQQFWESSPVVGPGPVPGAAPGRAPGGVAVPPVPLPQLTTLRKKQPEQLPETETPATEAEYSQFKLDPTRAWMKSSRGGFRNAGPRVGGDDAEGRAAEAKTIQAAAAGYYGRAVRAHNLFGEGIEPLSLAKVVAINSAPIEARSTMLNPDQRAAYDYIDDFVRAKLRKESGAVISPDEMRREYVLLFPQPGEGPADRERKAGIRQQAIEQLRVQAGPAAEAVRIYGGERLGGPVDEKGQPIPIVASVGEAPPIVPIDLTGLESAKAPPLGPGDIGFAGGTPAPDTPMNPAQTAAYNAFTAANPKATADQLRQFGESIGAPIRNADDIVAKREAGAGYAPAESAVGVELTPEEEAQVNKAVSEIGAFMGTAAGMADIATMGTANKIIAAARDLGGKGEYGRELLMANEIERRVAEKHPWAYHGGQAAAGLALPIGRARTAGQLAAVGAGYSAAHAAGSSDTLAEAAAAVPVAAAIGAAGGAVGAKVGEKLGEGLEAGGRRVADWRASRAAARGGTEAGGSTPAQVADALTAEGIPASGPLIDPTKRLKMATLETTPGGHQTIRSGLEATRKGIAARAEGLAPGEAQTPGGMGETIQAAGVRHIKELKRQASNPAGTGKYDLAAKEAGTTVIPATEAIARLDNHIAELSRNPGGNKGLLAYLKTIRRDFVKKDGTPIDKTVADIRNIRTGVSGEINRRNLSGSNADRIMNDVLEGAGRDIEGALGKAKPEALKLYQEGDALWSQMHTDRQQFIESLTGPKDNPFSGESAVNKVRTMMGNKGDAKTFNRVMDTMTPDERANFAATMFENIGRNSPEEPFSPAVFLAHTKGMNMPQLRRLFGDDTARSIMNLRVASHAYKATAGALNVTRSGAVQNFKDMVSTLLSPRSAVGGALGFAAGGYPGAIVGAATGEAIKRGANFLSARSLMNPNVGRWVNRASKAESKGAIMTLIDELPTLARTIARKDSAIAGEITGLREYLLDAMKDSFQPEKPAQAPAQAPAR